MEPWLIIDAETGAAIRTQAEATPVATGEEAVARAAGNMVAPPLSIWSQPLRGWVDVPLIDGPMMGRILYWSEVEALVDHPDPAIARVATKWMLLIHFGRPQRANSPLHISVGQAMFAGGVLDATRLAQFLAAEPVATEA
jgi:hypothetical protein